MDNVSVVSSLLDWCVKHAKLQGRELPYMFNINHEAKLLIRSKLLYIIFLIQHLALVTQREL